jgi:hypothetical protein
VTAIGVLSIVLGSLAALGELISIFPIAQIYFLNLRIDRPNASRVSPPAVAPVNLAPYAGDLKAPDGLGRAEALVAVTGINGVLDESKRLSPNRQVMLARLLAECGRKIFAAPAPLNEAAISGEITEAGQFGAGPDGLYERGTHFIRTKGGVILIDDSVARFMPPSLGRAGELRVDDDVVTQGEVGRRRRSAAAVAEELDDLRVRLGPSFNAMQAGALAQARLAETPPPLRNRSNRLARAPDRRAVPGADARMVGTTLTYNSALWILADGRVIRDTIGRDPRTGSFTRDFVNPTTGSAFRRSTGWLLLAGTIAEMLLAIFLVFCGIAIFRDSPRAAGWHLQYVWLKFAMIIVGIVLAQRFISELPQVVRPATSATATADLATMLDANSMRVSTAIGIALALIYPVALLFVVPGRIVRSWYSGLGGGLELISPQFQRRAWPAVAWVRTPVGRVVLGITGAIAALAAIGHLMLLVRADGGMLEHGIWMALCTAAALTCMIGVLVTPRGGAVAAVVMVMMLLSARPAIAQTTRPVVRKALATTQPGPRLTPEARVKFFLAQLPVDPLERQAAVGQLFKTAQGLRYWSPIEQASAGRFNTAEPDVAEAWNILLALRAARDPVIYELLNDQDVNVRREATWLLHYTSAKELSEASRAAITRAVPRLVEMVREKPSRLQPAALDRLRDAGDDGWRAIYQLLLDPAVSPTTQGQVLMRAAADPRSEFPAEDRKLAEQAVPKLLAMLTGPDLEGALTVTSARQVLLRLNGSPALAEGLKQLQADKPRAYEVATTRLTDAWLAERKARLEAQAVAAAQAYREQQAKERAAQIAERAAANQLAATRSRNEQEQEWVSRLARDNRPANPSEINHILQIPGLADLPPSAPMRVAVATALCRCGPDQFERWVDDAVSTEPAVATRARWLLTLASTASLPQPPRMSRPHEDRPPPSLRKLEWRMPEQDAAAGRAGSIGLEGIITTLSVLTVALTALIVVGYILLRPRIVSR